MEFFILILLSAFASGDGTGNSEVVAKAPKEPVAVVEAPADDGTAQAPEETIVDADANMVLDYTIVRENDVEKRTLSFGVPETDNALFFASCLSNDPQDLPITLDVLMSFGDVGNNDPVNMVMRSGSERQVYAGTYRVLSEEYAVGRFQLATDDPILKNATKEKHLVFTNKVGGTSVKATMPRARFVLSGFLADCADLSKQSKKAKAASASPSVGEAEDGETAKSTADQNTQQETAIAATKASPEATPSPVDPDQVVWSRQRIDLADYGATVSGLRGSVILAEQGPKATPVFRAYCTEDTTDGAQPIIQLFSNQNFAEGVKEQDFYLKFVAGDEYLETVLQPLDATLKGTVTAYKDFPVLSRQFASDSRFWTAMEVADSVVYKVREEETKTVPLGPSGRLISQFRNDCVTFKNAAKARAETASKPAESPQTESASAATPPADEGTSNGQPAQVEATPAAPAEETKVAVVPTPAIPTPVIPADQSNVKLPAAADPTKRWMTSRGILNNVKASFVRYGAPGGGETEFIAACTQGNATISSVSYWHFINDFPAESGKRLKLTYMVDGEKLTTLYARAFNDGDGYTGLRNKNAHFGKFYQGLAAGDKASMQVGDLGALEIPLQGSAQPMASFVADCKTYRDEAKAALKAAGVDDTPRSDDTYNNMSQTILAALQAEKNGVIADEPVAPNLPQWSKGQALLNNQPFSYVSLKDPALAAPDVFAACNATSTKTSNVNFWFAFDPGAAASNNSMFGSFTFGDEKQTKVFKPFDGKNGYKGISTSVAYFGGFWRALIKENTFGVKVNKLDRTEQYSVMGGHKLLLQFMQECRTFAEQAREKKKQTGEDRETDLVNPAELVQLALGSQAAASGVQPAAGQAAANAIGGVYQCDNGRQMQLALGPQNSAVQVEYQGLPTMVLNSIDNNAGQNFSDGFFTLINNGNQSQLIWGNTKRICTR